MKLETRYLTVSDLSVRTNEDGGREFRGYALRFGEPSENLGGFVEYIDRDVVIEATDVRHLINHDANLVLGRTTSGTTRLERDDAGVMVVTDMPDTSYARDLAVSIERRDVTQMSFGFRVIDQADGSKGDTWDYTQTPYHRHLRAIQMPDVSTVTFPAYPTTTAEVRAMVRAGGATRADGDVVWQSDAGFSDYQSDISASLPCGPDGDYPWGWVQDVALDGASALVSWYADADSGCQYYVASIEADETGEPAAADFSTWVAVEQEYVVDESVGRALGALAELRAGKAISGKNAEHVQGIADAAATMADHIAALTDAAGVGQVDGADVETNALREIESDRDWLRIVRELPDDLFVPERARQTTAG